NSGSNLRKSLETCSFAPSRRFFDRPRERARDQVGSSATMETGECPCPKAVLGGAHLDKFRSEIAGSGAAFADLRSYVCYNAYMTDSEIEKQILARNDLRKSAQLPLLDAQERARLRSARANRVFERSFASERVRFDTLVKRGEGWSRGLGKWVR